MAFIKKLPPDVASKIAAGEVVEKPFNVVKELIENSCDAAAKKIVVEITNGGLNLIKITDDGIGISKDDLPLALERFATSKAETVEDVYSANTFGFRGEALAAISSVSDFKIISGQDSKAYEINSVFGEVGQLRPAAAIKGTIIEAAKLFENLPARRKFLKSSKSLEGEILRLIKHFSLINSHIDISLISDGKELYHAFSSEDMQNRASKVFTGKAFVMGSAEYSGKKVIACATLPSSSDRLKRDAIIIGVNGRLIKDASLVQAVINSYHRLIPDGRYPLAVIDIRISPDLVDANVHPAKLEVRFLNAGEIFSLVSDAVASSFKGKGVSSTYSQGNINNSLSIEESSNLSVSDTALMDNKKKESSIINFVNKDYTYTNDNFSSMKSGISNINHKENNHHEFIPKDTKSYENNVKMDYPFSLDKKLEESSFNIEEKDIENIKQGDSLEERVARGEFRVIGQVDKTYIIIETENREILFIDQHVAHERILFEKLQAESQQKPKPSIVLHEPLNVVLTDEIVEQIDKYKVLIESFGYGYNICGIDKVGIIRIPYHMVRKNIAKEFTQIVVDLCLTGKSKQEEAPRAMLSCKSAIKAGDTLTLGEMEYLVTLLFNTSNFGTCPHGRPIIYMMHMDELARKFYR